MESFSKGGLDMEIIKLEVGDITEMRKPHPCGTTRFKVLRVGSEIRVVCLGCGRDMTLDRIKFEKAIKRKIPSQEGDA